MRKLVDGGEGEEWRYRTGPHWRLRGSGKVRKLGREGEDEEWRCRIDPEWRRRGSGKVRKLGDEGEGYIVEVQNRSRVEAGRRLTVDEAWRWRRR